jgi:hypothetical protein
MGGKVLAKGTADANDLCLETASLAEREESGLYHQEGLPNPKSL